jgi:hypothetical protein
VGSGSRDVDAWHANGLYAEDRGLQVPMTLKHGPVTCSGKSAPGPDPRIRYTIQIGMFRPIRVDHTNCLQVPIKTHSFILVRSLGGWRTGVGCSAPGHLHTAPSFCRTHGNVTHGVPAGALVNSPYSARGTECPKGFPLGQGCSSSLSLMLLLSKVFLLFKPESKPENEGIQNPNSNG